MSSTISEANLEKKFQSVANTQDSIQTLSLWILHHKAHHQKIVNSWMKVLQKAKISHRLTLFYLANDVIQNGKRKGGSQFGNSFAEVLREATLLVRDSHIRHNIQRVFNIWEERNVYDPDFIADLQAILANTKVPATAPSKLLAEFKPETVIDKIKEVQNLDIEIATKMSTINLSKLNATNAEIVQQLKDRTHGQQFSRDFEESTRCLEELIKVMTKEIKMKTDLVLLLEQSEIYYDTQRGEAKIVANAYKNFSTRVKTLQKKLEELSSTFSSPIPSPCPDAPSPTMSEVEMELDLPNENKMQTNAIDPENIENVPSPVGTPEGLNLPTEPKDQEVQLQPVSSPPSQQTIGNPIPTLSNFFSQTKNIDKIGMPSWLDTFSNKKKPLSHNTKRSEIKKSDPSSLDSRLSNLLQNIPNLPSGLHDTIFGSSTSGNNTPSHEVIDSPSRNREKYFETPLSNEATTPIKDEYSGQNTPLQDEDTHTSSQTAFVTNISSTPKINSPKEILKGLTNVLHSSSRDTLSLNNQKKDESYTFQTSNSYEQHSGISSYVKAINPCVSEISKHSSSPSIYFNSQPGLASSTNIINIAATNAVHSFQNSYGNMPTYSAETSSTQNIQENLSFIPTLVPSIMHKNNFNFQKPNYPTNDYNSAMQGYDPLMNIDNNMGARMHDVPALEIEPLLPEPEIPLNVLPRTLGSRPRSALITVVPEDLPSKACIPEDKPFTSDTVYNTDVASAQQPIKWDQSSQIKDKDERVYTGSNLTETAEEFPKVTEKLLSDKDDQKVTPQEPIVCETIPQNGQTSNPIQTAPTQKSNINSNKELSKIETVHSHRKFQLDENPKLFGSNWTDFEDQKSTKFSNVEQPHLFYGPPKPRFFENKRGFPPPFPHFHPRNNWHPRERPGNFFHPYGPPPPNARFHMRGRMWGHRLPQF